MRNEIIVLNTLMNTGALVDCTSNCLVFMCNETQIRLNKGVVLKEDTNAYAVTSSKMREWFEVKENDEPELYKLLDDTWVMNTDI